MNSALQALSNSPPLTQFFLECGTSLITLRSGDRKPGLSRSYHRLIQEMWHKKRPGYVVPTAILYGIRNVSHWSYLEHRKLVHFSNPINI